MKDPCLEHPVPWPLSHSKLNNAQFITHLLGGSGGMLPQEIFGILDVLRSILVHFGTLVIEPHPNLNLIPALQLANLWTIPWMICCHRRAVASHCIITVLRWLSLPCHKALIEAYKEFFFLSKKVVQPKPDQPNRFRWPCDHRATTTGQQPSLTILSFDSKHVWFKWGKHSAWLLSWHRGFYGQPYSLPPGPHPVFCTGTTFVSCRVSLQYWKWQKLLERGYVDP